MAGFNVICGLPRSGSTLLCNILNQNPRFHASSTSALSYGVNALTQLWSNSPEVKSDLHNDKVGTELRLKYALSGMITGWYAHRTEPVIFDKGRSWCTASLILKQLYPDSVIIACVRDLRAVFGSCEKQHKVNPLLDDSPDPMQRTQYSRADRMFAPNGVIGSCVVGVEDLLRRRPKGLVFVQYESLVKSPKTVLQEVYAELGEDYYKHDFTDVANTADDVDALYLCKFPHTGDGPVEPRPDDWQEHVAPDLAQQIMQRYQGYNRAFSYR